MKFFFIHTLSLFFLFFLFSLFSIAVHAQVPTAQSNPPTAQSNPPGTQTQPSTNCTNNANGFCVTLNNPLQQAGINDLPTLVQKIIDIIVTIATPVIVIFFIYSGFLFVFARGDPAKLTTARTTLLWTVIGAAVILAAWVIAQGIQATIQQL